MWHDLLDMDWNAIITETIYVAKTPIALLKFLGIK